MHIAPSKINIRYQLLPGVSKRETVKNAAKLAVYEAMMINLREHN